jgi:hypothetical protein
MALHAPRSRPAIRPRMRRHAFAHEHARPGRGLEHVVDAGRGERAALLVGPGADLLCYTFALGTGDVVGVGIVGVGF